MTTHTAADDSPLSSRERVALDLANTEQAEVYGREPYDSLAQSADPDYFLKLADVAISSYRETTPDEGSMRADERRRVAELLRAGASVEPEGSPHVHWLQELASTIEDDALFPALEHPAPSKGA